MLDHFGKVFILYRYFDTIGRVFILLGCFDPLDRILDLLFIHQTSILKRIPKPNVSRSWRNLNHSVLHSFLTYRRTRGKSSSITKIWSMGKMLLLEIFFTEWPEAVVLLSLSAALQAETISCGMVWLINTSDCNSFSSPLAILWERFRRSWRSDRFGGACLGKELHFYPQSPKMSQNPKVSHKSPICWVAFPESPSKPPPKRQAWSKKRQKKQSLSRCSINLLIDVSF